MANDYVLVCTRCGNRTTWEECVKLTLPGIRGVAPGDCEPEEYGLSCPHCGAPDDLEPDEP